MNLQFLAFTGHFGGANKNVRNLSGIPLIDAHLSFQVVIDTSFESQLVQMATGS